MTCFNSDISPKEVNEAIHHLKANKAAGHDGIIPEVYKYACDKIIPFLVHLFNTIFTSGEYPEAWTEAIILSFYKKGSIYDPDNYRGISLLDVCSKLYNHIIDKRLSRWTEDHDALRDSSRFSQRPLNYRPYFYIVFYYVAFIDFRKAVDFIAFCKLWPILSRTGIKGKNVTDYLEHVQNC